MTRVLIIGGVAGGAKTAAKLRRLKPDYEIIIYTKDPFVSYSACGLPFYIADTVKDLEKLVIRTVPEFEEKNIHVHTRHYVEKIIPDKKQILIKNLDTKEEFYDSYDKLVIATGAEPFIPNIKNVDIENIFTLRNLTDGRRIKNKLEQSEKAAIIGGNYIGVELMESFVKQDVTTTIIEARSYLMSFFDEDMSKLIQDNISILHPDMTKIKTSDTVTEFRQTGNEIEILTLNGTIFKADMVVIAAGVRPCVKIAKDAGIELGITGAIRVNKKMQTSIPDIWAVGDCAEKFHIVSKTPVWIPLGSTANKEGRICALNIAGIENEEFEGVLGSSAVRYFGFTSSKTGLSETDAVKLGFNPVSSTITKLDKPKYMPDTKTITIKLTADKDTHKILGAQGIGFGNADKRINIITPALLKGYTLEEFVNDDITYSPPLSTSIDPILTAAHVLIDKLNH